MVAQPTDGRVLAWELLRPSLPHAGGLRRQATCREARAHGRRSVRRPGPRATRWPGGTSAASSACAACQRALRCLCAGSAAVWWPLCAPLGARVWATAACAHARAVATLLMRRPRSSPAMASCGPSRRRAVRASRATCHRGAPLGVSFGTPATTRSPVNPGKPLMLS